MTGPVAGRVGRREKSWCRGAWLTAADVAITDHIVEYPPPPTKVFGLGYVASRRAHELMCSALVH